MSLLTGRVVAGLRRSPLSAGKARGIVTEQNMKSLGKYPVPPDQYIFWKNRWQVPGGQIEQSFSGTQQKIMWQYFYQAPSTWWNRFSDNTWTLGVQSLIFYLFVYKMCEADVEEDIRAKTWF
eukprot:GEMP01038092.1.p1 GENE.GEMP01038092.1~~GEMP01038092.1.p1  ORF type:complete len:122 (-),score=16.53 GEMP01038092.1:1574-1939(-)